MDLGPTTYPEYVEQRKDEILAQSPLQPSWKNNYQDLPTASRALNSLAGDVVKKARVEKILRKSILTDNYYFDSKSTTFTNVYPVEERLMEDMVDSFHLLSQDVLKVMRVLNGAPESPRAEVEGEGEGDEKKRGPPTRAYVVENIEQMLLKTAQGIVVNLEKSKERNFKKLRAEQRGAMESLTTMTDAEIEQTRDQVAKDVAGAFAEQLEELERHNAETEARLDEALTMLSKHEEEVTMADAPAAGVGASRASSPGRPPGSITGSKKELSRSSSKLSRNSSAGMCGFEEEEWEEGGGNSSSGKMGRMSAIAMLKNRATHGRKQRDLRRGSMILPPIEDMVEKLPKQSYFKDGSPADFDILDSGLSLVQKLSEPQREELNGQLLQELSVEVEEEVVRVEELRREKENESAKRIGNNPTHDILALREDLLSGALMHIGDVRVDDFDRLREKAFGPEQLIALTIVEHRIRYGAAADAQESTEKNERRLGEEARKQEVNRRNYRQIIRANEVQRDVLQKHIVASISILDLYRFKHSTEVALSQLSTLSAWRALSYYSHGGCFKDVLQVHLEVLDRLIERSGGMSAALQLLEEGSVLDVSTMQWPDHFRIKALELLRRRLLDELDTSKNLHFLAESRADDRSYTHIEHATVNGKPFDFMDSEANQQRIMEQREEATMQAEKMLEGTGYNTLNNSINKLRSSVFKRSSKSNFSATLLAAARAEIEAELEAEAEAKAKAEAETGVVGADGEGGDAADADADADAEDPTQESKSKPMKKKPGPFVFPAAPKFIRPGKERKGRHEWQKVSNARKLKSEGRAAATTLAVGASADEADSDLDEEADFDASGDNEDSDDAGSDSDADPAAAEERAQARAEARAAKAQARADGADYDSDADSDARAARVKGRARARVRAAKFAKVQAKAQKIQAKSTSAKIQARAAEAAALAVDGSDTANTADTVSDADTDADAESGAEAAEAGADTEAAAESGARAQARAEAKTARREARAEAKAVRAAAKATKALAKAAEAEAQAAVDEYSETGTAPLGVLADQDLFQVGTVKDTSQAEEASAGSRKTKPRKVGRPVMDDEDDKEEDEYPDEISDSAADHPKRPHKSQSQQKRKAKSSQFPGDMKPKSKKEMLARMATAFDRPTRKPVRASPTPESAGSGSGSGSEGFEESLGTVSVATTKAAKMRASVSKTVSMAKFSKYDTMKREKKRKMKQERAEAAAATLLDAEEGEKAERDEQLQQLVGEEGGSMWGEDEDTASVPLYSQSTVSAAAAAAFYKNHKTVAPPSLAWMHPSCDRLVTAALFGADGAVALVTRLIDAITLWHMGQGIQAAAGLHQSHGQGLAPELIEGLTELMQGGGGGGGKGVPQECLEVRDKLAGVANYFAAQMHAAVAVAQAQQAQSVEQGLHAGLHYAPQGHGTAQDLPTTSTHAATLHPHPHPQPHPYLKAHPHPHPHLHGQAHPHATAPARRSASPALNAAPVLIPAPAPSADPLLEVDTPESRLAAQTELQQELQGQIEMLELQLRVSDLSTRRVGSHHFEISQLQLRLETVTKEIKEGGEGQKEQKQGAVKAEVKPLSVVVPAPLHVQLVPPMSPPLLLVPALPALAHPVYASAPASASPKADTGAKYSSPYVFHAPAKGLGIQGVGMQVGMPRMGMPGMGKMPAPAKAPIRSVAVAVATFDNSTQTAHGSIHLHELECEESDEEVSHLVRGMLLDGTSTKKASKKWASGSAKEKRGAPLALNQKETAAQLRSPSHSISTSSAAEPMLFQNPSGHTHSMGVEDSQAMAEQGLRHAYFDETEFEVLPGVRLASAHRVAAAVAQYVKQERCARRYHGSGKDPASSVAEEDLHIGSWIMSSNIRYCIREAGASYGTRLRRAPDYIQLPQVEGCEALIFPSVYPVQNGVNLVTGERCRAGEHLALPEDVLLLQVAEDVQLPHGLTQVSLSPLLKLTSTLEAFLLRNQTIPLGQMLVQLMGPAPVQLPVGVEVKPGICVAETPLDLLLPSNVILVSNPQHEILPDFMHRLNAVTNEEDGLLAEMKMNEFCCVVRRPHGVDFPMGVEILQRPPGHPLPPGMVLLPLSSYPDGLVLPEQLELVQLTPRFDFPLTARLNEDWKVWPRPSGVRLPPGVQIVYPDSTAAVPQLPAGVCATEMPDLPYGVILPPKSQAVELFGTAAGRYPLPEGAILAPGITVLNGDELMPSKEPGAAAGAAGVVGPEVSRERALNVLLVRRLPGTPLPPLVERGSKSDLPVGTRLAEHMDIVRVAVRFELPPGVRIQAGAKLGAHTQIAPGTNLVTLSGGRTDEAYSCSLRVLEWPYGVSLTPGTEFVTRPPKGYYLPMGYKEVVQARHDHFEEVYILPPHGMLVELPRAVHYATAQNLAELVTVGVESMFQEHMMSLPIGMVLASRKRQSLWPAEMTPAPRSALNVALLKALAKVNARAATHAAQEDEFSVERVETDDMGFDADADAGVGVRHNHDLSSMRIEAVRLQPHYSLPPGCEIQPGVRVLRKPFWLHVPSGVELVTRNCDHTGKRLPFCPGVSRVNLRPDYISTALGGGEETGTGTGTGTGAGGVGLARKSSQMSGLGADEKVGAKKGKHWELLTMERTSDLSFMTIPAECELVCVSELFTKVHSWGPYLAVEAVDQPLDEGMLPPWHFLIQRSLAKRGAQLPEGFALGVSAQYAAWKAPSLPPMHEVMHVVPAYFLPMGINIINTEVLSRNKLNTKARGRSSISQILPGEVLSPGFSIIAKPFGSLAMAKINSSEPFYVDEAHAFVRVHDPFTPLPDTMTLDRHSDRVVESVFGVELPPHWRAGFGSRHDQAEGELGTLEEKMEGKKPLMISDTIKFVCLPHGFPSPRARHKHVVVKTINARQALQRATRKIHLLQKVVGKKAEIKVLRKDSDLVVHMRLIQVHARDPLAQESATDKFLTNVLLHRLLEGARALEPDNSASRAFGSFPYPTRAAKSNHMKTISMRELSLFRLQDMLEEAQEQVEELQEGAITAHETAQTFEAQLAAATAKAEELQKLSVYDEELKVVVQRLQLKLVQRSDDLNRIKLTEGVENERLQVQAKLLTVQVIQLQDRLDKSAEAVAEVAVAGVVVQGAEERGKTEAARAERDVQMQAAVQVQVLRAVDALGAAHADALKAVVRGFEQTLFQWVDATPEGPLAAVARLRRPDIPGVDPVWTSLPPWTSPVRLPITDSGATSYVEDDVSVLSDEEASRIEYPSYQPKDMTRDALGRAMPLTPSFPLNLKMLYQAPGAEAELLNLTSHAPRGTHNTSHSNSSSPAKQSQLVQQQQYQQLLSEEGAVPPAVSDLLSRQRLHRGSPVKGKARLPSLSPGLDPIPHAPPSPPHGTRMDVGLGLGGGDNPSHRLLSEITAHNVVEFLRTDPMRKQMRTEMDLLADDMSVAARKGMGEVIKKTMQVVEKKQSDEAATTLTLTLAAAATAATATATNAPAAFVAGAPAATDPFLSAQQALRDAVGPQLQQVTLLTSRYINHALGSVLLHAETALRQVDLEAQTLRHNLNTSSRRSDTLDLLLLEARRKSPAQAEDTELREKVWQLEAHVARLLDQQTDPAVGVLASLVERLGELTTLEKQLRFSGLMYRQKSVGVEERLQGSKDAEMHPHPQGQRHQSPDSDDEDSFVASMQHMPGPLSTGALSLPTGKHPPFPILTAADVKALKFHSHGLRMKARACVARAGIMQKEERELMACVMEHMEAYQRSAQALLPPKLLERVLAASLRSYQSINGGFKKTVNIVSRAKGLRKKDQTSHDPHGHEDEWEGDDHTVGSAVTAGSSTSWASTIASQVSLAPSLAPSHSSSHMSHMSQSQLSHASAFSSISVTPSTASLQQSATSRGSSTYAPSYAYASANKLRPLNAVGGSMGMAMGGGGAGGGIGVGHRGGDILASKILSDASRSLASSSVKFGSPGSMPPAPTHSPLLLKPSAGLGASNSKSNSKGHRSKTFH